MGFFAPGDGHLLKFLGNKGKFRFFSMLQYFLLRHKNSNIYIYMYVCNLSGSGSILSKLEMLAFSLLDN